jgi:hypothetical protein
MSITIYSSFLKMEAADYSETLLTLHTSTTKMETARSPGTTVTIFFSTLKMETTGFSETLIAIYPEYMALELRKQYSSICIHSFKINYREALSYFVWLSRSHAPTSVSVFYLNPIKTFVTHTCTQIYIYIYIYKDLNNHFRKLTTSYITGDSFPHLAVIGFQKDLKHLA